jgi:hypothetical protein
VIEDKPKVRRREKKRLEEEEKYDCEAQIATL